MSMREGSKGRLKMEWRERSAGERKDGKVNI